MKKVILVCAAALLTTAACAPLVERSLDVIERAQSQAVEICSFLPTAETVAALLRQDQFNDALSVARVVCDAVTQPLPRGVAPSVGGVVIEGDFVDASQD